MFIVGEGGSDDKVYEYTLTENFVTNGTGTGYGISSSATFVDAFDVSSQDNSPQGIAFSNNGLKMFIVGDQNDTIYQYTLSENFDISTASYTSKSFDVDGASNDIENTPKGIAFSNDGLKMFIVGKENKKVYEIKLSENFDISTGTYDSADAFSVNSQENNPREIAFDYSGRYMFILGTQGNDVTVYKLSENFDVSTAVVQSG
jgi:sugar lactone lactonase YvrE